MKSRYSFSFLASVAVAVAAVCAIAVPVAVSMLPDNADAQPRARLQFFSETTDLASIADAAVGAENVDALGAELGDACVASIGVDVTDLGLGCAITAANVATITLDNNTGGAVDLASTTLRVFLLRAD